VDSSKQEYRIVYMIMGVAEDRRFGPPRMNDECEIKKVCKFLHLKFGNNKIDAVNIYNILSHKTLQLCTPPYFKMK
jgi:hypothetical protein